MAQQSASKWQAQPIVIDRNATDWVTIPRFFYSQSNVQYEFRNEATNLYLIIRTIDKAAQMQMMRGGFSLRLKVKTNIPTRCSITFPAHKMESMPQQWNNIGDEAGILVEKTAIKAPITLTDSANLEGFQLTNGIITYEDKNQNKISFARNKGNREQLVYEILIPLSEIYGKDFVLEKAIALPIKLLITMNELSQNSRKQGNGNRGRLGGEGMRSGGMQGGGL